MRDDLGQTGFTVFPVKPQKKTAKPQHWLVTTWRETTSWLFLRRAIFNFTVFKQWNFSFSISALVSLLRSRFLGCHAMLHPKKRLLTTEPHSFPFVFVVCLHFVEQTNHIIAKCEWRKISRVKASGFCFTPHARHQNWAVFVGYDHDGGKKTIWIKAPSTKASCAHCCTFGSWENICDFLEMSNCKRQSESFLQIENRIGAAFRTRCQQIERSYLISQSLYWAN